MYLYDGKSFTLYAKNLGYYATVPAPPTAGELAKVLADKYNVIEMPLTDLFWWGTDRVNASVLTAAVDAGPAVVDGISLRAITFSGRRGSTGNSDPARCLPAAVETGHRDDDQYLGPSTARSTPGTSLRRSTTPLTFDPPNDAHRIVFATTPGGRN